MDTPLSLNDYFFPIVQVVADPSSGDIPPEKFKIDVTISVNDETNVYQVAVEIQSSPEDDQKKQQYTIHLVVVGLFEVDPLFPDIGKLLYTTGSSMLYSAAREFLITVTSRGPWSAVKLPTFSFLEKYNEERKGSDE